MKYDVIIQYCAPKWNVWNSNSYNFQFGGFQFTFRWQPASLVILKKNSHSLFSYSDYVSSKRTQSRDLLSRGSVRTPFPFSAPGSSVATCMSLSERVREGVSCIGVTIIDLLFCGLSKNEYCSAISSLTYFFWSSWRTLDQIEIKLLHFYIEQRPVKALFGKSIKEKVQVRVLLHLQTFEL